ncbi:hypothetical protein L585_04985 [Pantoea ananatis BRT175]|nr:hypothetical protein L585_04985 [Pantoea ananatis BRT175]
MSQAARLMTRQRKNDDNKIQRWSFRPPISTVPGKFLLQG